MRAARDHVELLFAGEVYELDRIARNADGEVCVLRFLGVFHAVAQLVHAENVDVEVVSALIEVAVEDVPEVIDALLKAVSEGVGADGLGVRDTVERVGIGQLSNGIQRGEQTVLLGSVGRVRARCKGCAGFSAVGGGSGSLAVNHIRGDGEDGRTP